MSAGKNHSEEFNRYVKGQMSPEEAHAFEREILDDPFTNEALEGYEASSSEALQDVQTLKDRIKQKDSTGLPWMRMAVAAVLLIVASFSVYQLLNGINPDQELAMEEEPAEIEQVQQDSSSVPLAEEKKESIKPAPALDEAEESSSESIVQSQEEEQLAVLDEETVDELKEETEEDVFFLAEAVNETEGEEAGIEMNDAARSASVQPLRTDDLSAGVGIDTTNLALDNIDVVPQTLVAATPKIDSNLTEQLQGQVAGVQVENGPRKAINVASINDSSEAEAIRIKGVAALKRSAASVSISTVSGIVTDETGDPIPGVNVLIKGTTSGTQTDLDGTYELPKQRNMTLVFSYVGFESYEIEVGSRDIVDATLGGTTALQEVVITGNGTSNATKTSYEPATPRGGIKEFKKYLETKLQYPPSALENGIEGTVTLQLSIASDGSISNIEIRRSLGYGCDEEAIRLVRDGPTWRPAVSNGNRVEDKARVKVKFKLEN